MFILINVGLCIFRTRLQMGSEMLKACVLSALWLLNLSPCLSEAKILSVQQPQGAAFFSCPSLRAAGSLDNTYGCGRVWMWAGVLQGPLGMHFGTVQGCGGPAERNIIERKELHGCQLFLFPDRQHTLYGDPALGPRAETQHKRTGLGGRLPSHQLLAGWPWASVCASLRLCAHLENGGNQRSLLWRHFT